MSLTIFVRLGLTFISRHTQVSEYTASSSTSCVSTFVERNHEQLTLSLAIPDISLLVPLQVLLSRRRIRSEQYPTSQQLKLNLLTDVLS